MHAAKWLSAAAGMALATLASAQTPAPSVAPQLYTVEIVVFRTRQPLGVAEDWSAQSTPEPTADDDNTAYGIDPGSATAGRADVHPVSSAQFKLAGTDAALRRSSNYQVLSHVAWTQAATPRGSNSGTPLAELGITDSTLRGTVTLEQGRYLYLNLDVSWTPADPPSSLLAASRGSAPVTFTLKQKRRVRAFEQHYFDHPAFGVIAIVSPVT